MCFVVVHASVSLLPSQDLVNPLIKAAFVIFEFDLLVAWEASIYFFIDVEKFPIGDRSRPRLKVERTLLGPFFMDEPENSWESSEH